VTRAHRDVRRAGGASAVARRQRPAVDHASGGTRTGRENG
jgi:hypothetical protein